MNGFQVQIFQVLTTRPHYTLTADCYKEMFQAASRAGNRSDMLVYKTKWELAVRYNVNHVSLQQAVAV